MADAGSKTPLSVRTPACCSPVGCGARVGPEAEVLLRASSSNGLLCSEQKIYCREGEKEEGGWVERASARGDGPSDGEFWRNEGRGIWEDH